MEITSRIQDRENPSTINSPRSNGTSPSSNNNSNGGSVIQNPTTPPLTPKTISRSETTNPYPTTFVQADTSSFKQVVQMLTGSSDPSSATKSSIPPIRTAPKKQGFKLYERRNSLKNGLMISPLIPGIHHHHQHHAAQNMSFNSPRNNNNNKQQEILSPSILDFPSLALSPVTPLNEDPFNKSSPLTNLLSEEDKAIAEKKFYLHPSPRRSNSEPQLLPLFPLSSPRVSGSSS